MMCFLMYLFLSCFPETMYFSKADVAEVMESSYA
jgi:hypothetical protein